MALLVVSPAVASKLGVTVVVNVVDSFRLIVSVKSVPRVVVIVVVKDSPFCALDDEPLLDDGEDELVPSLKEFDVTVDPIVVVVVVVVDTSDSPLSTVAFDPLSLDPAAE